MVGRGTRRWLAAGLMALAALIGGGAEAQSPPNAAAPQSSQEATISSDAKSVRARLDAFKASLDQNEATLQGRELTDADLQRLRTSTEPLLQTLRQTIEDLQPKLEASKARLAELGPKPKDGQPEESADVARDRADREGAVGELDETQRLARALLVQATQISTQIGDRRRSAFTRALFNQSSGILSPDLWYDVAYAMPREIAGARHHPERYGHLDPGPGVSLQPAAPRARARSRDRALYRAPPRRPPAGHARSRGRRAAAPPAPARRPRGPAPRGRAGDRGQLDRLGRLRRDRHRAAAHRADLPGDSARPRLRGLRGRPYGRDPGPGPRILAAHLPERSRRSPDHPVRRHAHGLRRPRARCSRPSTRPSRRHCRSPS